MLAVTTARLSPRACVLPLGPRHSGLLAAKTPETIIPPRGMRAVAREAPGPLSKREHILWARDPIVWASQTISPGPSPCSPVWLYFLRAGPGGRGLGDVQRLFCGG